MNAKCQIDSPVACDNESIDHSEADVLINSPALLMQTFRYRWEAKWYQIGGRIRRQSGWRPVCSLAHFRNIAKVLPLLLQRENPLVSRTPSATHCLAPEGVEGLVECEGPVERDTPLCG